MIGSGFAGLSAACKLAQAGANVTIIEKNEGPGGRARAFTEQGYTFDMGPSWYWMPDVFEDFFSQFGKSVRDYYELKRLSPSYKVIWKDEAAEIPADYTALTAWFEQKEKGAGKQLDLFLKNAAYKYKISMKDLVYMPGISVTELFRWNVFKSFFKIKLFTSMHSYLRRYFRHPKLLQLTEFPVLFLGALPKNTPALYSLMNYADMKLGTWYPAGGMVQIVNAMHQLAESLGVKFIFNEQVSKLQVQEDKISKVVTDSNAYEADAVIAACDYHYAEQLLPENFRNYSKKYWDSRKMAPSCLLYYIGIDKKIDNLLHHTLFFDAPFNQHAAELYTTPKWPEEPLMYICCPSKTDSSVAPKGCENLFILIPVAPGMLEDETIKEHYYGLIMSRLEDRLQQDIRSHVVYKRSYAYSNFVNDYNAFKGNAYGLANTLMQTAFMKPSIRNKKVKNLFYTGQLTVPGPGVPPAIISGQIVAKQMQRLLKLKKSAL